MRKKGAGAVGIVVLVVVIVVCVGFIVWYTRGSGPPAPPDMSKQTMVVKCAAQGCDYTATITIEEAMQMSMGAAWDGSKQELYLCPKCKKFSVSSVAPAAKE